MSFISSLHPTSYGQQTITDHSVNINNHTNSLAEIKYDIANGIKIVKENIENGFSGDLATLEKVLQLLNHSSITENQIKIINKQVANNKNCYTVVFDDNKLFAITIIVGETRFATATTSGDDVTINLKDGFNVLYNETYASDYDVIDDIELDDCAIHVVNF